MQPWIFRIRLQTLYTSGTVFHAFLGEKLPDWKAAAALVRTIAENYKLPYYTLSPTYSVCRDHGYIAGEHFTCPSCGKKAEVYSRITGYYRPVQNWNDGKAQEYKDRRVYRMEVSGYNRTKAVHGEEAERFGETAAAGSGERNSAGTLRYLFTTSTCPNCRIAKEMLADEPYQVIDAEQNPSWQNSTGFCRRLPWLCWKGKRSASM